MLFPELAREASTHPVYNEDLAHIQPLLEKFGCNCHGVKVAEAPAEETHSYCFYTIHSRALSKVPMRVQGKASWFFWGPQVMLVTDQQTDYRHRKPH